MDTEPGEHLPIDCDYEDRVVERLSVLEARVTAKLSKLNTSSTEEESRLFERAVKSPTVAKRVFWLRQAAERVQAKVMPVAACRSGCSHCCHVAVLVSRPEAMTIAREIGAEIDRSAGRYSVQNTDDFGAQQAQLAKDYAGSACPFLAGGRCSIYAHRPLACRLLINLDDDDLLCQSPSGTHTPMLDVMEHNVLNMLALGVNQDFDDIRRWFPRASRDLATSRSSGNSSK